MKIDSPSPIEPDIMWRIVVSHQERQELKRKACQQTHSLPLDIIETTCVTPLEEFYTDDIHPFARKETGTRDGVRVIMVSGCLCRAIIYARIRRLWMRPALSATQELQIPLTAIRKRP
ncbi:hypothetical protein CC2G_001548 [Coprinopsis cinerea AmutBmut pab1-1]|nr:hypothetical protein CC2G_001548 [Coprinopsis cinerea AmutBmut pab1-1]